MAGTRLTSRVADARRYPLAVRASWIEIFAAATLFVLLTGLVVVIVLSAVPPGGPPALQ